jgi:4-aminobutyrate aminotransferase-like enzyme
LLAGLEEIAGESPLIGDIRGHGLFLAVELVEDGNPERPAAKRARRIVNALKEKGILTGVIGPDANVLKLRPPMVISEDDANFFLENFRAVALAETNS